MNRSGLIEKTSDDKMIGVVTKNGLNMLKILSKLFSVFACILSLCALLIFFWAYFIEKKVLLNTFILSVLFCGYIFIFELYNLLKNNNSLRALLLARQINAQGFIWNLGSIILGGCFLYLGFAKIEDFSNLERKLFIFCGLFLFLTFLFSFRFRSNGINQYYALPVQKRNDIEKRISSLDKFQPIFALVVIIVAFIFYILTRR